MRRNPFLVAMVLQSLSQNRLRNALSITTVFAGTLALAAVQVLSDGLYLLAERELLLAGSPDLRLVAATEEVLDGLRFSRPDTVSFDKDDLAQLDSAMAHRYPLWLRDSGGVRSMVGARARGVTLLGFEGRVPQSELRHLAAGRFPVFDSGDESDSAQVTISHRLARELFPHNHEIEQALGARFVINGIPFRVMGVVDSAGKDRGLTVWGRRTSLMRVHSSRESAIVVAAAGSQTQGELEGISRQMDSWMGHDRPEWDKRVRLTSNAMSELEGMRRRAQLIRVALGAFCILTVLVASIGIANVMFASVLERTREIGIHKAIGARTADVFRQFLTESIALGLSGAILGILAGVAAAKIVTEYLEHRTMLSVDAPISGSTIVVTLLVGVTSGVLAGIVPALRASRLSPVDAIRHE